MKRWIGVALLTVATLTNAQTTAAKKGLVAKLLLLQQPGIENIAQAVVERPAMQLMQEAGRVLQMQVPPDKREAIGKAIDADVRKFVDESTPLLRERAVKLAPSTVGATLEEKFSEDELKQLIAWFESPVNKKFQQIGPEMQSALAQKVVAEAGSLLQPKLQALEQRTRAALSAGAGAKPAASAPKAAASAAKPAAKAASK
jgi:hypothetical protein